MKRYCTDISLFCPNAHITQYVRLLFALFLLAGVPDLVTAKEAEGLNLKELFDLALRQDAGYLAEIYGADAQQADGWEKIASYGPTLSITGSYGKNDENLHPDKDSEREQQDADFYERVLTISFEQPLIDGGKAVLFQKGKNDLRMAELQREKSREALFLRVATAYYEALSARESFRIANNQTNAMGSQLQNAMDRLTLGVGTITDRHEAESRYRLSVATEISRETEWKNARTKLAAMVGGGTPVLADISPDYEFKPLLQHKAYWLGLAEIHNKDLLHRQLQANAARYTYYTSQSKFLPSLSLYTDYNKNRSSDGLAGYGEERNELGVGLIFRINLLKGGSDIAATTAAFRRMKEAEALRKTSWQDVGSSIEALYDNINDTARLITAYKKACEASKLTMESVEAAYLEGAKALPEVLDSQQEYFTTLAQYHRAQYSYLILLARFG